MYPLTDRIRKRTLAKRLFEMVVGNIGMLYLIHQHMIPIGEEACVAFSEKNYFEVFEHTLHMAVPAAYLWLLIFLLLFHSYLNFWAELTRFADRRFYSDWWNAGDLSEFWRKWN